MIARNQTPISQNDCTQKHVATRVRYTRSNIVCKGSIISEYYAFMQRVRDDQ